MFGEVFFHPYSYYAVSHGRVNVLKPKTSIKIHGLFLKTVLSMQTSTFSYNNMASSTRLSKKKMLLPVKKDNTPDWDYMEEYIITLIQKIDTPQIDAYTPSNISLNSIKWQEFRISDVMEVLSGVRLTTSDMTTGDIPFIGATDSNNGITNWISDINTSTDANVLGVNYNGSVGEAFYHPYTATFSDDVKRLKIKEYNVQSKEVYLFIKTMILQQKEKYAYGYKFNGNRMKAQKIMLPITKDKDINWQFMEDYIKSISNAHLI